MFTGIVEEIGTIKSIKTNTLGLDICIEARKILEDINLGDSISVNGCCQTVTNISSNSFTVQAVVETVNLTNFQYLKQNSQVNLERALTLSSRLGGHIVSGHIDGTGVVKSIENMGNSVIFKINASKDITNYIIYKGSITVNGVSLTVCNLNDNDFSVSVIPHTIENTNFKNLKVGDIVNLEPDVIAKYVEKLICKDDNNSNKITLEFLKENGF